MNPFVTLNPQERSRTYIYNEGDNIEFMGVVAVSVSDSGTHRLNMSDGTKVIVAPGWKAISLDTDDWTF